MRHVLRKSACLVLLVVLLCSLVPEAKAKSLEAWLEGYDLGDTWFGDDYPYDITDEAACWEFLMKPITVLDVEQNEKVYPRQTPNGKKVNNDKLGGSINGASAAVHVLGEDEDGWTLIEGLDYYNRIIRGYVRTKLLKTVTPNTQYGIIIDKLTQRMYVFIDGKLWDSCLVSTGLPNNEQPYNETAAGEYLVCSRVGDFDSDGMICSMALRFNGGDMIHEVPHKVNADGTYYYDRWEEKLGSRASHGCVRTQRVKSENGLNAKWLWDNIKMGTKVLVWDDRGRKEPYPDDDLELYYNPSGGSYYHANANCSSVKSKFLPLSPVRYGDLYEGNYATLTACTACRPPKKRNEIVQSNYERGAITQAELESDLKPIAYPDINLTVYRNPNGGKYYHRVENCSSVKQRYLPLSPIAYRDLETQYAKLTPCPYCSPALTPSAVDKANLELGLSQERVDALRAAYEGGTAEERDEERPEYDEPETPLDVEINIQ